MHHKLIVLTDVYKWKDSKKKNTRKNKRFLKYKTSLQVRKGVYNGLLKQGFCQQGKFSSGPADWLVIGGRWSGELGLKRLNPLLWASCKEKIQDKMGNLWKRKKALKIFKEFFPDFKGLIPFFRSNQYDSYGAKDDAQMVDKPLWKKYIRDLIKESGDDYYQDPLIYLDGTIDECEEEEVINKMWAVVVDYHS